MITDEKKSAHYGGGMAELHFQKGHSLIRMSQQFKLLPKHYEKIMEVETIEYVKLKLNSRRSLQPSRNSFHFEISKGF